MVSARIFVKLDGFIGLFDALFQILRIQEGHPLVGRAVMELYGSGKV